VTFADNHLQVFSSHSLPAPLESADEKLAEVDQASLEGTSRSPAAAGYDCIHSLWLALNSTQATAVTT